jgi:hypothetical protein
MTEVTLTHIGGPTVLLEVEGWRRLTDPTFDAPGRRYTFGWGSPPTRPAARRSPPPTWARSMWSCSATTTTATTSTPPAGPCSLGRRRPHHHPGARRLGGNARGLQPWATIRLEAELRAGEALVFDWTSLAFCCAAAGEISLRPTTLRKAQRSPAYLPLRTGDGSSVFAHRRAYPMLVGRDIEVDCRRRLGVRSFSSSLPPTSGCTRRSDASPEATAGTARLPVPMLRPTDAQQEIRRTIGQLSANAAGLNGWLHHLRTDRLVGGGGGGCGPGDCQQQNKTRYGRGGDRVSRCG